MMIINHIRSSRHQSMYSLGITNGNMFAVRKGSDVMAEPLHPATEMAIKNLFLMCNIGVRF